ncbi:MAG: signal recognition particle-docking protein FtsY [Micrococcales bacterium]|nr:signal recognition particle-docking protein FtsY [Micrococcales bacterium]
MTSETVWVLIVVAVLVVGALAGLVLGRSRRSGPAVPPTAPPDVTTGEVAVETEVPAVETTAPTVETAVPTGETTAEPEAPVVEPEPVLEQPEPSAGRLVRLRQRLAKSGSPLGVRLLAVLSRDHLTDDDWDELEETLLLADVGAGPTGEIVDALRAQARADGLVDVASARAALRDQLLALVDPTLDRSLATTPTRSEGDDDGARRPAVVLVVGVNGTGKTTTIGKLARLLVADGSSVVLGAADTFRAAAADQLQTWGSRVGVTTVRADRDGADPASVAFDAVRTGRQTGADVVLLDTAGRLQNKAGLMDELGKIVKVASREAPLDEVLLVLDATTGQNGLTQARVFAQVAGVTGIVLTKLDGTAKGGIVIAVQRELGVPVKLVGLGEGPDDLAPFDADAFVDGLLDA